jgi:hypothetical protein
MFSLFKILFLLASFFPLIFANCKSGEIPYRTKCCDSVKNNHIDLSNVTKIGNDAFAFCANLTSVSFGKNLTSIGDYAFQSTGIRNVSMPMSLYDKFNTTANDLSFTVSSEIVDISIRLESYNETITNIYNCSNSAPNEVKITSNCIYTNTINNPPTTNNI